MTEDGVAASGDGAAPSGDGVKLFDGVKHWFCRQQGGTSESLACQATDSFNVWTTAAIQRAGRAWHWQ